MNIDKKSGSRKSFTLAEMLITLTVVSVVAIITLPALMYKIDDFRWNSARQKMVYNIREAARRMAFASAGGIGGLGTAANFRDQLANYLATAKSCDTVTDCFPATIRDIVGNNVTTPISGADLSLVFSATATPGAAVGLILNNGTSLHIIYNSACTENDPINDSYGADHVCANIIFDINGLAPPNQVGKDIGFASVIDPKTITVTGASPDITDSTSTNWSNAITNCSTKGESWHLPTKDELNSLIYNKIIIGSLHPASWYWSSSEYVPNLSRASYQTSGNGYQDDNLKSNNSGVRCVKR